MTFSFLEGYLQTRELDKHREQGSSPEHLTRLILQALHLFKSVKLLYSRLARQPTLEWLSSVALVEPFGDGDLGGDELVLFLTH
jgi:hypothetical protein